MLKRFCLLPLVLVFAIPVHAQQSAELKRVEEFVEAFNTRNIDAMLALADENIQWLSVSGAKLSIETEGKTALRQSMERYFKSCPSCKSKLEWIHVAGSRVSAMERASWTGKNGARFQSGLSVYEFGGGKILRVYYFPAEVDPPTSQGK